MRLTRPATPPRLISLVSMIDVLLIMLVFFMVTSTYLDLDMIPMAKRTDDAPTATSVPDPGQPLVVRLGEDGLAYVQGRVVDGPALAARVAARPAGAVTILPSLRADTQALVTLMDTLTAAGAGTLRILQVAGP